MHTKPIVGLQRTDNNMEFTNWPQVQMINQKNYYTYVYNLNTLSLFVHNHPRPLERAQGQDGQQEDLSWS